MKILTKRKKSRKLLYQELFAMSMNSFDSKLFRESFFSDDFEYEFDDEYINEMKKIILKNEAFFIFIIKKYSPKFNIKFMSRMIVLPIYI
jgi:transcription termination factor NusB